MEFRVLGPLEVVIDGTARPIGGPKRRALLATLLLGAGEPISRERLIDELWGDDPPSTAANTLQVNVAALRRVLGDRLRTQGPGYLLDIAPEQIDSRRFETLTQAAAIHLGSDPQAASRDLANALGLWRGDAFTGVPRGEAVSAAAARLDELHLTALEDRAEAHLALGRHAALVAELTGVLDSAPTRERLAGQLMLALHRCGRSADALAVYAKTCRVLDDQLGVDPGDALTELNRAIHRGDPTLAAPGPPSLPVPPTRFIGRVDELARAGELLAGARLLTLSGVGGCGKTRLALELARRSAPSYPGGVHLVDLAPVAPEASVGRQVAAVLGVRERRGATLAALLATYFRHHRALLVLDNCEHVGQPCAELCSRLLEAAPGLRVLATSREPLGIPVEVVFYVPGLSVPLDDDRGDKVQAADAVRLLVERATAAQHNFTLGPGKAAIAADLCRRLDGLPLAIELAAARLRNLSLEEVAAGVDERLDAFGGSRSIDIRHRTMRASIEWSHDMLDEAERIALRRLSVFAGGFGPLAAEAVVGGWRPLDPSTVVLDVCGRLVDKSMLVAEPGLERTGYRMLEIVRQFAAERLAAAGESASTRTRHAAWYHDFVPDARQWAGPDQALWMDRLRREVDNVHAALAWYLGDGWEAELALEMSGPMWWFWYMGGRVGEGRIWLNRVLAATAPEPSAARGLAVRGAAALARITGEFAEALRLGAESLDICRVLGDERGVAAALNNLCISAMMSGDLDAARRSGEEGLEIITRLGDASGVATAHNNLGLVARISGDLDRAAGRFAIALNKYRAANDRRGIAAALSNLAILGRRRGDTNRAQELAVEALQLYTELGFDEGQLDCLEVIAAIAADRRDGERALRLLTVAARAREELGAPLFAPDELAQVRDAEAMARDVLTGAGIERVLIEARDMSVADAVAAVLTAS